MVCYEDLKKKVSHSKHDVLIITLSLKYLKPFVMLGVELSIP